MTMTNNQIVAILFFGFLAGFLGAAVGGEVVRHQAYKQMQDMICVGE